MPRPLKSFTKKTTHLTKNPRKRLKIPTINLRAFFGIVFFGLGILIIALPRFEPYINPPQTLNEPIKAHSTYTQKPTLNNIPTRVIIPAVSIDLPVTISHLERGVWVPSETSASFGEGSASPGENNNTVIFAHAREGLFLPLRNVTIADTVYVFTKSAYYSYTVESIQEVNPLDVYTVKPTDDERLTLFTCSGFFDQKRLVIVAKPAM